MARYIDAEELFDEIKSLQVTVTGLRNGKSCLYEIVKEYQKSVLRMVDEQPTADVVEVVRCKDCMSWRGKDHDGVCIENGLATRMANEFCSRGKKKGGDSDA